MASGCGGLTTLNFSPNAKFALLRCRWWGLRYISPVDYLGSDGQVWYFQNPADDSYIDIAIHPNVEEASSNGYTLDFMIDPDRTCRRLSNGTPASLNITFTPSLLSDVAAYEIRAYTHGSVTENDLHEFEHLDEYWLPLAPYPS